MTAQVARTPVVGTCGAYDGRAGRMARTGGRIAGDGRTVRGQSLAEQPNI